MMKGYIEQLNDAIITPAGTIRGMVIGRIGNKQMGMVEFPFSHIHQIADELLGFTRDEGRAFLLVNFDMESYRRYIEQKATPHVQNVEYRCVTSREDAERIFKNFVDKRVKVSEAVDERYDADVAGEGGMAMTGGDPDAETVEAVSKKEPEAVHHPDHYGGDTVYEVIKCLEAWFTPEMYIGACRGQAIIYLARADRKEDPNKDLSKAIKYIEFEKEFRTRMETGNVGNARAIMFEMLSKMSAPEIIQLVENYEDQNQ